VSCGSVYPFASLSAPSKATSTTSNATWNIVSVNAGNKTVYLDEAGASSFDSAFQQLEQAWIPIVTGKGQRDQTETIKEMATRYNIPFTTANETAQKLRDAGHQVADPWKSQHETGMAIDVYGDSKLGKVSKEQEAILNANGWYSAGIPWDAGHFEYRGVQWDNSDMFTYLDSLTPTERTKELNKNPDLKQEYIKYQASNLSPATKTRVDKYVLDFENQPEVKDYSIIKSQLEWAREYAKESGSNTDDQALIYTFAKVMDPGSVVRESEYGTVQEYSQDLLGRYAGKISRIYSTDWFLTQDAKDKMLKTLETKLKASERVMKNIRNATAKQLNQITGKDNGADYLKDFVWADTTQPTPQAGWWRIVNTTWGRIKK